MPNPQLAPLLQLPDPLLLAVLQCLADEGSFASLYTAARAHPRLQQAAAQVVSSVSVQGLEKQQQLDDVLLYLGKHGQHISSVSLAANPSHHYLQLQQLAPCLRLDSLQLANLHVKLRRGTKCQGVLGYEWASSLKQLRLSDCRLLDTPNALHLLVSKLVGLEHLSINCLERTCSSKYHFPTGVLEQLPQLTFLEMSELELQGPVGCKSALQPLQALTKLRDLRLRVLLQPNQRPVGGVRHCIGVDASMLSGAQHLTHLETHTSEAGVLAGKTQLQHLRLFCSLPAGGLAQLLSHLGALQQLTYLSTGAGGQNQPTTTPAAAFSALTASSQLQHLSIDGHKPAEVWQHVFPTGRQLLKLTSLQISWSHWLTSEPPLPFDRLVSCCPNLQSLNVHFMHCTARQLAPLLGLSRLQTLLIGVAAGAEEGWSRLMTQCPGLRELDLYADRPHAERLLLQTTHLKQLTKLRCHNCIGGRWIAQAPGDEPVWRQVLRMLATFPAQDPEVAQQAAAALAE